jgi:hypothetical protein
MKPLAVASVMLLSACLDSLTLVPEVPAIVEPRQRMEPMPVVDAGEPVVDAGEPVVDAGEPMQDAGVCQLGTVTQCGACGDACAVVAHADAVCRGGSCGRGPCHDGFFDFDPTVGGCETNCVGTVCSGPNGVVTLTAPPVNERAHGLFSTTGIRTSADRGVLGEQSAQAEGGALTHRAWFH